MSSTNRVDNQLHSIERLLQEIAKAKDPTLSAAAKEIVQALMEFHGAAIERMLELVHENAGPENGIIDTLGRDPVVRNVLLLYGLHPEGIEVRVRQALEKARPSLKAYGGSVNLIGVDEGGAVTVRLEGSGHGCGSSSENLRRTVEEAIYEGAPDVTAVIVLGSLGETLHAPAFVPLAELVDRRNGANGSGTNPVEEALPASRTTV